jgi:hypothetical protein
MELQRPVPAVALPLAGRHRRRHRLSSCLLSDRRPPLPSILPSVRGSGLGTDRERTVSLLAEVGRSA